ncbi:hypothetical protein [Burkholderia vietnamiensis]|uniref:hypothetical protein n=1 Tax=Burkholderia vietnamiensis TaxID=60552 RepID=UPI0012D98235|nr:hypothetical protein [Burkholderia vietnamiensis]
MKEPEYAFPVPELMQHTGIKQPEHGGMHLRDYFAAAALNGMLSAAEANISNHKDLYAKWAYQMADEMMAARKRT